jgi:hypothetical protein
MAALPRGTAYFTINPPLIDDLTPHYAGWYAGDDPWSSVYGGPLRLASDARRFDVSPAWHAWVAAAPAVRLLAQVGTQSLHRHALGLANRFRAGIGLEPRMIFRRSRSGGAGLQSRRSHRAHQEVSVRKPARRPLLDPRLGLRVAD